MKKLVILLLMVLIVVSLITAACAPAKVQVIRWRAYTPDSVEDNGYKYLIRVADEINEKSNGRLVVTVYPGEALGYRQEDMLRVMQQDTIEMAHFYINAAAGDEPLAGYNGLPFLVGSLEGGVKIVDALKPMWNEVILPKWHAKGLAAWAAPPATLAAPRKVDTVEAWKGLKVRGWSEALSRTVALLGGVAVDVPYSEVYTATATGIIEGNVWSAGGVLDGKLYELVDYLNLWFMTFGPSQFVVNTTIYDELPSDLQKIVVEAATNWNDWVWQEDYWTTDNDIKTLAGLGMTVVEVSDAEKAKAAEILAPVYDEWLKKTGPEGLKWLNAAFVAQGRSPYK